MTKSVFKQEHDFGMLFLSQTLFRPITQSITYKYSASVLNVYYVYDFIRLNVFGAFCMQRRGVLRLQELGRNTQIEFQ